MSKRNFLTTSLPAVALAAWLLAPGLASGQHHGGGHAGGGHAGGGHAGGGHVGVSHAGGFHGGGTAFHRGGWGGYRGGYYGRGYGGYWGGHRGSYGFWPGFGLGLGLGWGLGYYPGYYGYGYGYSPYAYYGAYEPWYGDYYGAYEPYYATAELGTYTPEMYGGTYGYYEPSATGLAPTAPAVDNTARIIVRVPPDAKVWFEDTATTEMGARREFESPPLTPGKTYVYDIRVQWREDGREVTQTRHIDVHAGDRMTVDFTTPSGAGDTTPPKSPTPPPPPRPSGS